MNTQVIVQPPKQNDTDVTTAMKAALALLNGKRESLSKEFNKRVCINLDSLVEIDNLVNEKLSTEKLCLALTTIDFSFENGKKLSFMTMASMCEHRWKSESKCISTILVKWDFLLVLPNYTEPQRHTLSLRLMDMDIPEFLYDMGMIDDSASSFFIAPTVVCRIDFINNIIAEELLSIIGNWVENRENKTDSKIQKFARKRIRAIYGVAFWIGFSIIPLATCIITKRVIMPQQISEQILPYVVIFLFVPAIANQIGQFCGRIINKRIMSYWSGHIFQITNGDSKKCTQIEKKRTSKKEWVFFFVNIFVSIVLTILAFI